MLAVAIILAGAGCVAVQNNGNKPKQEEKNVENTTVTTTENTEIDTKDWKTYENKEYGFSFRYPLDWGTPVFGILKNKPFDTGSIASVTFVNNKNIEMYFFSDDYSQGVGEGTSNYFDRKIDFTFDEEQLKKDVSNKNTGINIPVTYLTKLSLKENIILKIVGYRGYVTFQPAVSYIVKNINDNSQIRNLLVVYSIGEINDVKNNNEFDSFVKNNNETIKLMDKFVMTLGE